MSFALARTWALPPRRRRSHLSADAPTLQGQRALELDDSVDDVEFGAHSPANAAGHSELIELLNQFWRRKGLIFGVIAVCMVVAAAIISQLTPQYSAMTYIMINSRESRILNIEEVLSGLSTRSESVLSEVRVLQSRQL